MNGRKKTMSAMLGLLASASLAIAAPTEVRVSELGRNPEDSTEFIRAALKSAAPTVVLDRAGSPWVSGRLFVGSNKTIVIPEGAELVAKRGEFHGRNDTFLSLHDVTNVVITGGGTIRMWFEDYTNRNLYAWSEWRHALSVQSCSGIRIENLKIVDSGGDGIYLGQLTGGRTDRDIVIRDVLLRRCNRQGISVIAADELLIERTVMEDTCGTPPMAGIDFEPNYEYQTLRRIRMRDCVSRNNRGAGYDFSLGNLSALAAPVSIALENCTSEGNAKSVNFQHAPNLIRGYRGIVAFRNCAFADGGKARDMFRPTFRNWIDGSSFAVVFQNSRAPEPLGEGDGWPSSAVTRAPDGSPLRIVPFGRTLLSSAVVHDRAPGQTVRLSPVGGRKCLTYVVYAAQPGKVRLAGLLRRVGSQYKFAACPISVRKVAGDDWRGIGKALAKLDGPTEFNASFSADFEAPEAGFYRLDADPSPNVLQFTECDAPIAIVARENRMSPELNGAGAVYLDVPEGSTDVVFAAGHVGTAAHVGVRLSDPSGAVVWENGDVGKLELFQPKGKVGAGVWKMEAFPPKSSWFGDYTIDAFGVPAFLFLSSEKTWSSGGAPLGSCE